MPCKTGGEVGGCTGGTPCFGSFGRSVKGCPATHHDIKAEQLTEDTVLRIGGSEERRVLVLRQAIQQLGVHLRIQQQITPLLRNIIIIELGHQAQHVCLADTFALTGGLICVSINLRTGGFNALCGGGTPVENEIECHIILQFEFILTQDGLPFVIAEFHRVGVRDKYRISGVFIQRERHIDIRSFGYLSGKFGSVFLGSGCCTGIRNVNNFSVVHVLIGVERLAQEAIGGKQALHDSRHPNFFLNCHFYSCFTG